MWYDKQAVSNLFSLSDVVKKGMHVFYDSDIADEFKVTTNEGRTILFPVDRRGLYVKESYDNMKSRLNEEEKVEKETSETTPPLIEV